MPTATIIAEPNSSQITVTRTFAAPPAAVFRAYTDPALLSQWLGPAQMHMEIDYFEPRDGGRWRYLHHAPDGQTYGFRGVFHGEPTLAGIVQTFEFEGAPGHVSLEAVTFEPRAGGTLLRILSAYQSVADRDAMIASGMESGLNEGLDRLETLLAGSAGAGA